MLEQFHPTELIDYCVAAEEAGFSGVMAADHLQPWVPQQGQAAFVWAFMAAVGGTHQGRRRPGRDLPVVPHSSGGHRPGRGDAGGHVPGSLLARPGVGRGAQRARRRAVLAGGARADQPDVRGDRDLQPPVHRQRRQARRSLLQDGDGPALDAARDAAADSTSRPPDPSPPSAPVRRRTGSSPSARPRARSR